MSEARFTMLDGGIELAVAPLDWQNKEPGKIAAVKECLQQVARAHGVDYQDDYFAKTDELLSSGVMDGYRVQARWGETAQELCLPRTIAIALHSKAVIYRREGKRLVPFACDYRDDTAVLSQSLGQMLRECRPKGIHFPDDFQLSHYLEQEIAGLMQENASAPFSIGTLAEVSRGNTAIMRVMEKIEASVGSEETGPVVEFGASLPLTGNRWTVDVMIELPTANNVVLPYSFLTRWVSADGRQEIGAAHSLCPSSMSRSVPHVHLVSNGEVPEGKLLEDVLDSLLTAGQYYISLRQERERILKRDVAPSPIIDIHGGRQRALQALMRSSGYEMLLHLPEPTPLFGEPLSETRIYCFEKPLHQGLIKLEGRKVRQLGPHALYPVLTGGKTALRPNARLGVIEAARLEEAA